MKNARTPIDRIHFYLSIKYFLKSNLDLATITLQMHALISLVDLIKKHLDNEYFACGIFIDLQKAFDTVDHDILNLIIMVYVD